MMRKLSIYLMAGTLALLIGACQVGLSRNPDGSLRVEGTMSEEALANEVRAAVADPLIEQVDVTLENGYARCRLVRKRPTGGGQDELSFRLALGVVDGHLTATLSDVDVNGFAPTVSLLAAWNQRIASNLERAGRRTPNSTLQQVDINPDGIQMVWRVETARSR
jgi:hypothetical protein